ncbi:hypothetical protein EXU57_16310 [Segetibacter sp. 3557_3]|uniref:hypothetical protein n=1 Tax=Segetibacter sp. 3557_3 TaxID=2547429 RepID=UPI0010591A87|nr:hypothetical protein [Segetibacter sp. 3557_3]TDH24044.1 hypothetical protein EXU57_16310 [Segetibacter sp. 3557_3]
MAIDTKQLELNINLHALQPGFLNSELHYVIASAENNFRFAGLDDEPAVDEEKFYCFLTEEELFIPAGNMTLPESYVLRKEPAYPVVQTAEDFESIIANLPKRGVAKAIRKFSTADIEELRTRLTEKYGTLDCHVVKSGEGQHLLFVINTIIDISIAANMVYFRYRNQFGDEHPLV